jgi:tRNA(Ile)-lysidine synthase
MSFDLYRRLLGTARRHGMFTAGDRVGVAVSGGADSVALLLLLHDLREKLGVVLSVLHFNHHLRGPESDADEQFVRELAARLGYEYRSERADVAAEARRKGWNLEDAGRRLRLELFGGLVAAGRLARVAVAHTADDQAETVLAHLLRGTGLTGLSAIHPVAGPVVRPLVQVRRAELRAFLASRGQAWREDSSNLDTARLRARIRHRLIPLLEAEYQPAVVERLCALADLAAGEEACWRALTDPIVERAERSPQGLLIAAADLLAPVAEPAVALPAAADSAGVLSVALARRVIRRLAEEAAGRSRLTAAHVDQVLHLALSGRGGQQAELPGGLLVERTLDGRLRFSRRGREAKPAATSYEYHVPWPLEGAVELRVAELGRRFRLISFDWPAAASDTREGDLPLDAGLLTPPLVLRNWRPGDAYRPAGRRREYKLKELLYRARVEARQRRLWPVLASAAQVVWTRGFPPAAALAAGPRTRRAVRITEEKIED